LNRHIGTFLTGISILLPIGISIYVVYFVFNFIDKLTGGIIYWLFGSNMPGVGFITTIVLIYILGMLTKSIVGRTFINKVDKIFLRIPLIQHLYSAIKGLSNSLLKKEKVSFKQTVLVPFPSKESLSIGFVTSDETIKENKISVFIPTVPNPTTGFLILVDKSSVEYLPLSFEEAFRLILSLGVNFSEMTAYKRVKINKDITN